MTEPAIRGYRGEARDVPALVARLRGRAVQLLRADLVVGADHLRHAAALAGRAVAQGRSRSPDLATETLVYAAGERQIGRALERMGLAEGVRGVPAVAWGPDAEAALDALAAERGWIRDDAVLDAGDAKLDAWGIGAEERAVVPRERWGDLVLERVALVDVLKA